MADNDIFALMKANKRLAKNVAVAKKVVARKDYSGPEGEVVCRFNGQMAVQFDGIDCAILQFSVDGSVPGQEDYNGERIGLFYRFQDDDYGTVESRQAELFEAIQMLGIDTVKLTEAQIKAALDELRKNGNPIKIRVVKKKGKGANAAKTYTNFRLVGTVKAESNGAVVPDEDEEWSDEDVTEPETEETEVETEVEAEVEAEEEGELAPTDWIGFEVKYKTKRSPKPLTFKIIEANDEAGTVVLEREGKKVKANYADLILPED